MKDFVARSQYHLYNLGNQNIMDKFQNSLDFPPTKGFLGLILDYPFVIYNCKTSQIESS